MPKLMAHMLWYQRVHQSVTYSVEWVYLDIFVYKMKIFIFNAINMTNSTFKLPYNVFYVAKPIKEV